MNMGQRSGGNLGDLFTVRLPAFCEVKCLESVTGFTRPSPIAEVCWLQGLAAATLIDSHR